MEALLVFWTVLDIGWVKQLMLTMDPLNNNTQVGEQSPISPPVTQPVPVVVPETQPIQPSVVEQSLPAGESPKGSSVLMKAAIWILVAALLVAIGYVVYANFFAPAPAAYIAPPVPTAAVVPTPIATEVFVPTALPTSTASATPISTPTGSPSTTPAI